METIFEPSSESEMSRDLFKGSKQGAKEDISSWLSKKFALYDRAYAVNERNWHTLFDHVIATGPWTVRFLPP